MIRKKLLTYIVIATGLLCVSLGIYKYTTRIPDLNGKIIYHTYSTYEARDSKLYIVDLDTKTKTCISDSFPEVINPMNADFNPDGTEITFMGIENEQWQVFTYNFETKKLSNITDDHSLRSEDPKYSFDGSKIVFKQEYLDSNTNEMVYDIKEYDLNTKETVCLTEDNYEDSMPCYSYDNNNVYYAQSQDGSSAIYKIQKNSGNSKMKIFNSENLKSYYPIASENYLYFTKAYSETNKNDTIVRLDFSNNKIENMPFNNSEFNCSDAYPVSDKYLLISSTMDSSKGGYDLYLADTENGKTYSLSEYIDDINDENEQLGASYHK